MVHEIIRCFPALAIIFGALVKPGFAAVTYRAIDLSPNGFYQSVASSVNGTQQIGYGIISSQNSNSHALLWNGSAASVIDLNPANFNNTFACGMSGNQQVGYGGGPATGNNFSYHALLWNGSASSCVDLNGTNNRSRAYGTDGSQQVGYGANSITGYADHAFLWSGSANNVIDLNPTGFLNSYAYAINSGKQAGYGFNLSANNYHALLWSGSANNVVDLNPSGYTDTYAYSICGNQQVGRGVDLSADAVHALLWKGTAASAVDLNPSGFRTSSAMWTNGIQQVGIGTTTLFNSHALLWSGTASSSIDLHLFLPSGYKNSEAISIDAQGNIVGKASDASGNWHAILWTPIPEPSTLALLSMSSIGLIAYGWRRQKAYRIVVCFIALLVSAVGMARADVFNMPIGQTSLQFVTVGDLGNAGEQSRLIWGDQKYYGSVSYTYNIGKFEISSAQYVEFLNAVAKTDTYGLYNPAMADPSFLPPKYTAGCNIQRQGSSGIYTYSVTTEWANRPINYVSLWDAKRFCNWLQNGQPSGLQNASTTETGAYTLNGYLGDQYNIAKNTNARYYIPSENEWYKAAYYKGGGNNAGYWNYATQSNSPPVSEAPPGKSEPPGSANYWDNRYPDPTHHTTEIGAYVQSPSPYGTYDQNGNVTEWNDTTINVAGSTGIIYDFRGGFYSETWNNLSSDYYNSSGAPEENWAIGFRIASVPEPGSLAMLLSIAVGGLIFWRKRRL